MKPLSKTLVFITLLGFVSSCKYTEAPSAGLAKEMCSCIFVSEQTEQYCRMVTKEARILSDFEVDYNRKEVSARGVNFRAMAKMDANPRYGCSLKIVEVDPESAKDYPGNER
ncbi:MAG: hypothetical protein K9K67_12750 [Bacteriovoracaceae bacterium]|nr:hypothetical protein [Bacteriovoracaceae bacterium]